MKYEIKRNEIKQTDTAAAYDLTNDAEFYRALAEIEGDVSHDMEMPSSEVDELLEGYEAYIEAEERSKKLKEDIAKRKQKLDEDYRKAKLRQKREQAAAVSKFELAKGKAAAEAAVLIAKALGRPELIDFGIKDIDKSREYKSYKDVFADFSAAFAAVAEHIERDRSLREALLASVNRALDGRQ